MALFVTSGGSGVDHAADDSRIMNKSKAINRKKLIAFVFLIIGKIQTTDYESENGKQYIYKENWTDNLCCPIPLQ